MSHDIMTSNNLSSNHKSHKVERRGGVVSESDARPEGREFEFRPIRDVR